MRIEVWALRMTIGTKTLLYGAHCMLIHPLLLALAWWKLYGFPWDPRLWVAFFVHDLGYWGKPNLDGPEGKTHPFLGARIMAFLFDGKPWTPKQNFGDDPIYIFGRWGFLCLNHSRDYAKKLGMPVSRLGIADKLVMAIEPSWLYLPRVWATGELQEYLAVARGIDLYAPIKDPKTGKNVDVFTDRFCSSEKSWGFLAGWELYRLRKAAEAGNAWAWHKALRKYMRLWVERVTSE